MKVHRKMKGKRIFGACILFLMMFLTLITVVMGANGKWVANGSYSLVIEKMFDDKMSPEVLAEAKKKTYRFHIKGYWQDSGQNKHPIDETVEIGPDKNWKSEEFKANGPIHVSVTEITNNTTLTVNGKEYNMGDSRAETNTLFKEAPLVRELNNNGKIVLSRPSKKIITEGGMDKEVPVTTTSFFRITSEWSASEHAKPQGWTPYNKVVKLEPGAPPIVLDQLSAGKYTIEDLSVSGYTLKLGERTESVGKEETGSEPSVAAYSERAGETEGQTHGTFYINSYPGKLKITAGGTKGDGAKHYYTIKRVNQPDGARPFTDRTTDAVLSEETYVIGELPRGKYEVTEYTFSNAPSEFTMTVPQIETKDVNTELYSSQFGTTSAKYIKFSAGGDYITNLRYGSLRNADNKVISSKYTYDFGIRYRKTADQTGYTTTTWKSPKSASTRYSFTSPIYPRDDKSLAFAVWNVTARTADHLNLSWTENTRVEKSYTKKNANENYSVTIDDRGWIEITAPGKSDETGAEDVTYTYYLRKPEDDDPRQTLTLNPGETSRFENLEAGSYLVMEVANYGEPVGFDMAVSGGDFGSTEAGKPSEITVMDTRMLTITKPKGDAEDKREYTFIIDKVEKTRSGINAQSEITFPYTVTLKAGETSKAIALPAGTYTVTPVDDMTEVFEMRCSDSSQVHAEVAGASSVTFTNVFKEGTLGYRYVHEYYLKRGDKYIYEGNSPITTVGGRSDPNEVYNSVDITKEPVFTYRDSTGKEQTFHYDYMPENNGYGRVVTEAEVDSAASNGLRLRNRATEKDSTAEIRYQVDNDLTQAKKIGVDKDKTQVIILRYFRVLPEEQLGSYNYIHIYYRRDKDGDHWEGTSPITAKVHGQLNIPYDVSNVAMEPQFTLTSGPDAGKEFTYTYEQCDYGTLTDDHKAPHIEQQVVPGFNDNENGELHYHYNPNSNANHIIPTVEGNQIIILRYYRYTSAGTYKIVHEYYFREERGDLDTEEPDSDGEGEDTSGTEDGVFLESIQDLEAEISTPSNSGQAPKVKISTPSNSGQTPKVKISTPSNSTQTTEFESDILLDDDLIIDEDELWEEYENWNAERSDSEDESEDTSGMISSILSKIMGIKTGTSSNSAKTLGMGISTPSNSEQPPEMEISTPPNSEQPPEMEISTPSNSAQPPEIRISTPSNSEMLPEVRTSISLTEEISSFAGTLSSDDTYTYTFEGARAVEQRSASLGTTHKSTESDYQRGWNNHDGYYEYQYYDTVYGLTDESDSYNYLTNMEWAASTEEGNEIIILRYYRDEGAPTPDEPDPTPDDPDEPDPKPPSRPHRPGGSGGGSSPTPKPSPEPPSDSAPDPENPSEEQVPPYLTELPDPNDPASPDRVTIWENGVPKTYVKVWDPENETWVYILEEEIPTSAMLPKTGDSRHFDLWILLMAVSLVGLTVPFGQSRRNKKK